MEKINIEQLTFDRQIYQICANHSFDTLFCLLRDKISIYYLQTNGKFVKKQILPCSSRYFEEIQFDYRYECLLAGTKNGGIQIFKKNEKGKYYLHSSVKENSGFVCAFNIDSDTCTLFKNRKTIFWRLNGYTKEIRNQSSEE